MKTYHYTEDSYEQTVLDLFREMDYEVLHGPDVDAVTERDLADATIPGKLREAMLHINCMEKTAAQMLVISDMADTEVGTITAPLDRYMNRLWYPNYD